MYDEKGAERGDSTRVRRVRRRAATEGDQLTEFAQVVVTDDQAALVAQAIALALENSTEDQVGDAEEILKTLAVFFATVASEPKRFPITGRMASKLADIRRDAKGPAKPVTRRNRRKVRQLARQGGAKRRRVEHKENVANFNAAREAYLVDFAEMQRNGEEDEARARALMEQDALTPAEHLELLTIFGAPPAILEAAGKVRISREDAAYLRGEENLPSYDSIILPPGVTERARQVELEAKTDL